MSADRTLAPFGRRLAEVVENREVGAYRMLVASDARGPRDPRPGQFYMLAAATRWGGDGERPFLPRAFSYARAHEDGRLEFLLEAVGPGTRRLAELDAGDGLWLVGPLGRGFEPSTDDATPLLVGGGIGAAPILALAEELDAAAHVLLGFRSAPYAEAAREFERGGRAAGGLAGGGPTVQLATDDGSAGRHALVTELLREQLDEHPDATIYACGPPPMLEAVRAIAAERDVPAQLALESGMACGYGACFGCVVPTREGYVRLCVDGPVLAASELESALVPGAGH